MHVSTENGTQGTRPTAPPPTDAEIEAWCAAALRAVRQVPRDRVRASVRDGWVTLAGDVDDPEQRDAAERAVLEVAGVKGVDVEVAIVPRVGAAELAARVGRAIEELAKGPNDPNESIDGAPRAVTVDVDEGNVVLAGVVRALAEREEAERVAWTVPGVRSVENRIDVVP